MYSDPFLIFINFQVSENNNMTQYPMTARGAEMLREELNHNQIEILY